MKARDKERANKKIEIATEKMIDLEQDFEGIDGLLTALILKALNRLRLKIQEM